MLRSKTYKVIVRLKRDMLEVDGDNITIGIKSEPIKSKANMELVKKLAKHFDIPVQNVRIKSGASSKRKTVEIIS